MPSRSSALWQAAGLLVWATGIALLFMLVVYRSTPPGWPSAVAQVAAYLLIALSVPLLRPRVALPLGATPATVTTGLVLVAVAVCTAALVSHESVSAGVNGALRALSAGLGEEVVFRGALFDRLRAVGGRVLLQVLINALLFTSFHLPLVVLQGAPVTQLALVFVFGTLFSVLRYWSRGLVLPVAAHVAVDLAG